MSISDGLLCTKLAIFICRAAPPRCDGYGNPDPLRMVPFADAVAVSSVVFFPRDMALCLSVSVCNTTEKGGQIVLVFDRETSFDKSYTLLGLNSGIYKNKGTSFCNFVLTLVN